MNDFCHVTHAGGLPLSLHHLAVQFLLLAHKLVAAVGDASSMEYVFVRHLCQELEGVKQNDVQKTSKVQAPSVRITIMAALLRGHFYAECWYTKLCTFWESK